MLLCKDNDTNNNDRDQKWKRYITDGFCRVAIRKNFLKSVDKIELLKFGFKFVLENILTLF